MNRVVISAIFGLGAILLSATGKAATAYEALRAIQSTRGDAVMNRLVVVRGESGEPQPQTWTVIMNDPTARAGFREFVIVGGEIRSERTPLRRYGTDPVTAVLDFSKLNLDSDGAFQLAQAQAVRMKVGFDSLDYALATDPETGGPVWSVRLFDHMGAPVGVMKVSAVDGKVLQPLKLDSDARVLTEAEVPTKKAEPSGGDAPMGGVLGAISRTAGAVVESTKDTSVRVVGTVEEVLTGERTIGRDDPTATPTPQP